MYERFGAMDAASESWEPPGGGRLASRVYAWTSEQVRSWRRGIERNGV